MALTGPFDKRSYRLAKGSIAASGSPGGRRICRCPYCLSRKINIIITCAVATAPWNTFREASASYGVEVKYSQQIDNMMPLTIPRVASRGAFPRNDASSKMLVDFPVLGNIAGLSRECVPMR
ncbi:Sarcosine oxidase gamma subunit [Anopheles sinensis]|uniref:Sarcosine oxidase gamma subunit n=1 Tax=Anopheles sinensis TaxID=74873 RepID=A0A084WTC6_ANOSI|nr:Sarcosine oxidase gamma subunit [Anopheles sinensis]